MPEIKKIKLHLFLNLATNFCSIYYYFIIICCINKKKTSLGDFLYHGLIMCSIISGVPMYIIPSNVIYDPELLCAFLRTHQITRMLFTPSLLEAVLNTPDLDLQNDLKSMK